MFKDTKIRKPYTYINFNNRIVRHPFNKFENARHYQISSATNAYKLELVFSPPVLSRLNLKMNI